MSWPTDVTHELTMADELAENPASPHEPLLGEVPDPALADPAADMGLTDAPLSEHPAHELTAGASEDTFAATQHLLNHYLGMDSDGDGLIDMDDGSRIRPHNNIFWASDTAAHLSANGVEAHAQENVLPGQLLVDLAQGRQVVLPPHIEANGAALAGLFDKHGGNATWLAGVDFSDAHNPQILLADHSAQAAAPTPYPLDHFVDESAQANLSYVTTAHPPSNIMEITDGFNHEAGGFEQIIAWIKHHAPRLMSAFIGAGVGSLVGDIAGNDIASVLGHYSTEKVINSALGLDEAPSSPATDSAKFGVALMDEAERNDFLDQL